MFQCHRCMLKVVKKKQLPRTMCIRRMWFFTFLTLFSFNINPCKFANIVPMGHGENAPHDMKPYTLFYKCYDLLGCFNNDKFSSDMARYCGFPGNPKTHEIEIYFFAMGSKYGKGGQLIYKYPNVMIKDIDFQPDVETFILIHGSSSYSETDWVVNMCELLALRGNVIVVDWSRIPPGINNINVCGMNRVMGAEIAAVLLTLNRKRGLDVRTTHCIGHSVGAEICAFAGKNLTGQMASITGLDASAAFFEGLPSHMRLYKGDAQLVVGIHTSIHNYGFVAPYADVDFYFNGGFMQPECVQKAVELKLLSVLGCAHSSVHSFYLEALMNSSCTFWGEKISFPKYAKSVANGMLVGKLAKHFEPDKSCIRKGDCMPVGPLTGKFRGRGSFVVNTRSHFPYCYGDDQYTKERLANCPTYFKAIGEC